MRKALRKPWFRAVLKALTYKFLCLILVLSFMLIVGAKLEHAVAVAVVDTAWRLALYVAHERFWG